MEEVSEGIGIAMGELGIAGGFFILLIVLLVGGYRLAMQYMVNLGKKKAPATPSPAKPTEERAVGTATMMGIAKDEVETARAQARDILAGHKADLDEFKQITRDKLKVIDKKDEDQERDLKDLIARLIALEEWRKSQEKGS